MYLTKVILNITNQYVARNIYNCEWIHQMIFMNGFADIHCENIRNKLNVLYTQEGTTLYIQSNIAPAFAENSDLFVENPQTIDISKFQRIIIPGAALKFSCTCNPTKSHLGKRNFVRDPQLRDEWINRTMEKCGATLLSVSQSAEKPIFGIKYDKKTNKRHVINATAVTFTGSLIIDDAEKFWDAFCNGIGHEKSYGCGMIRIG